jgi:hypothetical protein
MMPIQRVAEETLFFSRGPEVSSLRLSSNPRKAERQLINLFVGKEYQKIESMLNPLPEEAKGRFFEKNGCSILHYAATTSSDIDGLKLIIRNIPETVLRELLRHNDFEILNDLAALSDSLENYVTPAQTEPATEMELVNQKWNLLGKIAQEKLLNDFLEKHGEKRYMSESVTQMIKSAIPGAESSAQPVRKVMFND